MKLFRTFCAAMLLSAGAACAQSQNERPQISNLRAVYDGTGRVTISYDLADAESDPVSITLKMSTSGGKNFIAAVNNPEGDIGFPVTPGAGKTLSFQLGPLNQALENYRIKLIADDLKGMDIQRIVDEVDSSRLRADLKNVFEGIRHPGTGAQRWNAVRDSIQARFAQYGLHTERQAVQAENFSGANVIGRQPGTGDESRVWIIDAHFDSVDDTPGADDNASGVVGMLEAARVLSRYNFNHTVKFIGFDLEEFGLNGSDEYTRSGIGSGESIQAAFNLEMIGYYSEKPNSQDLPAGFQFLSPEGYAAQQANEFRGNFIANIANQASGGIMQMFHTITEEYVPELKIMSIALPGNGEIAPDFRRSDHASFWDRGIPALMLTDGGEFRNKNYHTPQDVSDSLNFSFMSKVVRATVAAVAALAEATHAGSAVTMLTSAAEVESPGADFSLELVQDDNAGSLLVQVRNPAQRKLNISLTDLLGRLCMSAGPESESLITQRIEMPELPAGLYFLTVTDGNRKLGHRVVKR